MKAFVKAALLISISTHIFGMEMEDVEEIVTVPDKMYLVTKKDVAYFFLPDEKISVYKIKSDYARYPFLAPDIFNLCTQANQLSQGIFSKNQAAFFKKLNSALIRPNKVKYTAKEVTLSPSLLEFTPFFEGRFLTPPVLFNHFNRLNGSTPDPSLSPTLHIIVKILKDDAQTTKAITQILVVVGTDQKPGNTSYDIDISELTPEAFPNLKTLNVNKAPLARKLLNIPSPCNITKIESLDLKITEKLTKQLNDAKNPATISSKPIASTSKEIPISPTFIQPAAEPIIEPKLEEPTKPATNPIPIISTAPVPITPTPTTSYWQRWQNWIQKNKAQLVIGGTTAVGVTAGAYYLWRNPQRLNQIRAWFDWSKK